MSLAGVRLQLRQHGAAQPVPPAPGPAAARAAGRRPRDGAGPGRRGRRPAQRGRADLDGLPAAVRRPRDHGEPDRQRRAGAAAAPRAARSCCATAPSGSTTAIEELLRFTNPVGTVSPRRSPARTSDRRRPDPQGHHPHPAAGLGKPRRDGLRRRGPARHHPQPEPPRRVRLRRPLLPGGAARSRGGAHRHPRAAAALPRPAPRGPGRPDPLARQHGASRPGVAAAVRHDPPARALAT